MKKYEQILARVDKLAKDSRGCLYDRANLLVQVFNDPEFKEDQTQGGRLLTQILDSRLTDCPCNFFEIRKMLDIFPRRTQWTMGNLNEMRLEMIKQNKNTKKDRRKPSASRTTVTLAQYRVLEGENKELKSEIKLLKQHISDLNEKIRVMDETIEILKTRTPRQLA